MSLLMSEFTQVLVCILPIRSRFLNSLLGVCLNLFFLRLVHHLSLQCIPSLITCLQQDVYRLLSWFSLSYHKLKHHPLLEFFPCLYLVFCLPIYWQTLVFGNSWFCYYCIPSLSRDKRKLERYLIQRQLELNSNWWVKHWHCTVPSCQR